MLPIKKGDDNPYVKQLQFGLGILADGIFGPKTEKALKTWQKNMVVPQTGIMTEAVWNSIFKIELEKMKHLRFAEFFLHIREEDIDQDGTPDNRGEIIDTMVKSVWKWWEPEETEGGPPWCAIFISYCLYAAYDFGFESPRVKDWYEWLKAHDDALEIESKANLTKGNIYIGGHLNSQGFGHIFFVDPLRSLEAFGDSRLATIEGNTNEGGSRDGDGVYQRYRDLKNYWVYRIAPDG